MKRLTLLFALAAVVTTLTASEVPAPKIALGPYIQACGQNEFTVVWQTDSDALSWVEIAPDDGTHFYNTARQQFFQTIHGRRPVGKWHCVKVTGLEPGTVYRYRILHKGIALNNGNKRIRYTESKGSNVYRRQPYRVRTLDSDTNTTRFAVGNDFHDNAELLSKLFSKDVITAKDYDFVLFNGDMVSSFEDEQRLASSVLAPAAKQFAAEVPLFFSRGNHETRGKWAVHYSDYISTSTTAPYYTFSDGPAFFIVLDGGEDKPDSDIEYNDLVRYDIYREQEAEWLKKVVASDECKNAKVKVVILHIPPKSNGWHGDAEIARLFAPILNDAGVDAMICGHIHKYRLIEAGDANTKCNFPIICNPNRTRMDVTVSAEKITYSITNGEGNTVQSNEILINK